MFGEYDKFLIIRGILVDIPVGNSKTTRFHLKQSHASESSGTERPLRDLKMEFPVEATVWGPGPQLPSCKIIS